MDVIGERTSIGTSDSPWNTACYGSLLKLFNMNIDMVNFDHSKPP